MTRYAVGMFAIALLPLFVCETFAQQSEPAGADARPSDILAGRPDAEPDQGAEALGQEYESRGNGIALRPPKGSIPIRRVGAQDIVEFVDESRGWSLKLSKIRLEREGSLTEWRDPQGEMQPGVLEFTAKRLKENIPDAEFLRKEKINIGDGDVGVLALRYTRGLKSLLSQQAIIQRTDKLYYLLAFTTPGASKGAKDEQAAAIERSAVEAFRQVLDSVKLLDTADVRREQDARLIRTRSLLLNFTPDRIRSALKRQQWNRILKNGKDVGYSYLEESVEGKGGQDGIEVRIRSRVMPASDVQVDVGSMLYSSMDLRHEDWSTLSEIANSKQRAADKAYQAPQTTETGVSDRRTIPGEGDEYSLQVIFESTKDRLDPVVQELPPFYLPQAMSHLLPRLLPLGEPKTFMFAVYVPDTRQVTLRYVDVLPQRKVEFNQQIVRAVPVEDRIGLEGAITTHYMSMDNTWLGSENKESGITVVPSNEETLLKLWKDANLTRPEGATTPNPQAAEGTGAGEPRQAGSKKAAAAPAGGR